ncbi:hypothetical protein K9N50_08700 [bacterium]|nr:hypothetical protein [bacterium]
MKRNFVFYINCLAILLMIGCGGEKKQTITVQAEDGSVLRNVPDWYLEIPTCSDTVYSVGTSLSYDMLEAKRKALEIAVSDLTEKYGITQADIERLSKDEKAEKFILVKQESKVRAYVMLAIPSDKLN